MFDFIRNWLKPSDYTLVDGLDNELGMNSQCAKDNHFWGAWSEPYASSTDNWKKSAYPKQWRACVNPNCNKIITRYLDGRD